MSRRGDVSAAMSTEVWFAPGRANLMGEHTDYNEGFVLPFALAQGVTATATARGDGLLVLRSKQRPAEPVTLSLDSLAPRSVTGWAAYPAGVAWALRAAGFDIARRLHRHRLRPAGRRGRVVLGRARVLGRAGALLAVRAGGAARGAREDRQAGGERVRRRADRHHRPVRGPALPGGPRHAARLPDARRRPGPVPAVRGGSGRADRRHPGDPRAGQRRVRGPPGRVRGGRPAARRARARPGDRSGRG